MAININGQVLRNVPEQVSKNVEDIEELQDQEQNHETRITALEQNAIALATFEDCSFTGTTTIGGDIVQTAGDCSLYGDVSIGGSLTVTGSGSFAGISAAGNASIGGTLSASGNENVGGNLAVTGNITGGSIIENMDGYGFTPITVADVTKNMIYAGVCKNGNKITFVLYLTLEQSVAKTEISLGRFSFPSSIGDKLIPFYSNWLEMKRSRCFLSLTSGVDCTTLIVKTSSTGITFFLEDISSLATNTEYILRIESTFLLSDNLAS